MQDVNTNFLTRKVIIVACCSFHSTSGPKLSGNKSNTWDWEATMKILLVIMGNFLRTRRRIPDTPYGIRGRPELANRPVLALKKDRYSVFQWLTDISTRWAESPTPVQIGVGVATFVGRL